MSRPTTKRASTRGQAYPMPFLQYRDRLVHFHKPTPPLRMTRMTLDLAVLRFPPSVLEGKNEAVKVDVKHG